MKLELADSIKKLVNSKYLHAKSSGSLVLSPTELTVIHTRTGLPVGSHFTLATGFLDLMPASVPASVLPYALEEAGSKQI